MSLKVKKAFLFALSFGLICVFAILGVISNVFKSSADENNLTIDTYSSTEYEKNMTRPFWKSNVIYNEIVMPYNHQGADGTVGYGQLLYKPLKIISVKNQALDVEYTKGIDWIVDPTSRQIKFPSGSRIVGIDNGSDLIANKDTAYPLTNNGGRFNYLGTYEQAANANWNGTLDNYCELANVVYTEGMMYMSHYLSVTYVYDTNELPTLSETKESPFNVYNPNYLTKLRRKLESGVSEINFLAIGDSISAGCSATGGSLGGIAPNTPFYQKQICNEIERIYGVKVNYYTMAVGGTTTYYPLTETATAPDASQGGGLPVLTQLLAERDYDLCTIAYGMNDVGQGTTAESYRNNIIQILDKVMTDSPNCNAILVNSFSRNPYVTTAIGAEGRLDTEYFWALENIRTWYHPTDNPTCTEKYQGSTPIYGKYADGSVKVINMHAVSDYMMKFQYTVSQTSTSYSNAVGGAKTYLDIAVNNMNHPNDFFHRVQAMNIMSAIYDYPTETYSYTPDADPVYKDTNGNQFNFAKDENGWANVVQDNATFGQNNYFGGNFKYFEGDTSVGVIRDTLGYASQGTSFFNTDGANTYFHLIWGGHLVNYTPFDVTKDIIIKYNFTADNSANNPLTNNCWYGIALFDSLKSAFVAGTNAWNYPEFGTKVYLEGSNCDTDANGFDRSDINGRLKSNLQYPNAYSEKLTASDFSIDNWHTTFYTIKISIGANNTQIYANDVLFSTIATKQSDFADGVCYLSVSTGGNMAFNFKVNQTYNLTYNLDGGHFSSQPPTTYDLNSSTTLINPSKDGYIFTGWTGEGLTSPTMDLTISKGNTGDRSYTATWEKINQGGNQGGGEPVTPPAGGDVNPPSGSNDNQGGNNSNGNTPPSDNANGENSSGCGSNVNGLSLTFILLLIAGSVILAVKSKKPNN